MGVGRVLGWARGDFLAEECNFVSGSGRWRFRGLSMEAAVFPSGLLSDLLTSFGRACVGEREREREREGERKRGREKFRKLVLDNSGTFESLYY